MKYKLTKPGSELNVSISLPASKSISNRLILIQALAGNDFPASHFSDSDDTHLMLEALHSTSHIKDVGHAGTSMRFLTAYYSVHTGTVQMTGSDRMKERPIGPLVDTLRLLGADIHYLQKEGFPPLEIKGKNLAGGEISINSGISSQFISALLMIAPAMERGLTLTLTGDSVSMSYIKMTLELMAENGVDYTWEDKIIRVFPGKYAGKGQKVESDWSAASYWYAMGLFQNSGKIVLSYLKKMSFQGDSALVHIFHSLGILSEFENEKLTLTKLANIHPGMYQYDFTNSPDIVQSMAVALCLSNISFRFSGTKTLRIKETDRILALQIELKKLGYILESDAEGSFLAWNKKTCEPDLHPEIATYHDHRMAMAFAPAALVLGEIIIDDPMVVTKSYPTFWDDLKAAGFTIEIM